MTVVLVENREGALEMQFHENDRSTSDMMSRMHNISAVAAKTWNLSGMIGDCFNCQLPMYSRFRCSHPPGLQGDAGDPYDISPVLDLGAILVQAKVSTMC